MMTSDPAKPETRPATFRSHLPAIVAAATGTVLAAVLGSLIGAAGTVAGMTIGSLVSGTCSWWAERGIRRSAAIATARATAIRARDRQLRPDEDATITRAIAARHDRTHPQRRWAGPAALAAVAFIACAIAVTSLEQAAGKPLSALVQGKPGHGTTLDGGVTGRAAPASPAPTPSASTGPAATAPASSSPAASPTPTATTPGSTGPASTTHSAVPSAAPTVPASTTQPLTSAPTSPAPG